MDAEAFQVSRLPDVLAYGKSDAGDGQSVERYKEMFAKLLSRLRRIAPEPAILVIGPPDATLRSLGETRSTTEIGKIVTAQRNDALQTGCAFWDMRESMGASGPCSSGRAAVWFFSDLMRHYAVYERVRAQVIAEPIPNSASHD